MTERIETIGQFLDHPVVKADGTDLIRFAGTDAPVSLFRFETAQVVRAVFRIHDWVINDARTTFFELMGVVPTIQPADPKLKQANEEYFQGGQELTTAAQIAALRKEIEPTRRLVLFNPAADHMSRLVLTSLGAEDEDLVVEIPWQVSETLDRYFRRAFLDAIGGPGFISQYLFNLPIETVRVALNRRISP